METVQNKVAVVTGAASGIGLGVTRALAGAGAHVAMLDVEDDALAKSHAEFDTANVNVRRYRCDVSDLAQVEEVASRVRDDFGGVHIVCNNAGVGAGGPIDEATPQDWQWVLGVNLYGVVNGMRAYVPIIKETVKDGGDGHIVNTASVMGMWTHPGGSVYSASKYAVVAISEATREELASVSHRRLGTMPLHRRYTHPAIRSQPPSRVRRSLDHAAAPTRSGERRKWRSSSPAASASTASANWC